MIRQTILVIAIIAASVFAYGIVAGGSYRLAERWGHSHDVKALVAVIWPIGLPFMAGWQVLGEPDEADKPTYSAEEALWIEAFSRYRAP